MTVKILLLSALYLIIAVVLLILLDLGLEWFLNNVIFSVFDWFNRLTFFFKLFLLLIGGASLFWSLVEMTGSLSTLLGGLIFNKLPQNLFTIIAPMILAVANAIWYIIVLWRTPAHYNFWIICELILVSFFIWSLCAIVMPAKEQIKSFRNERNY